ncbi:MAG: signal peptide peptidase SppA [Thermodesulfovibrionia bacterium]
MKKIFTLFIILIIIITILSLFLTLTHKLPLRDNIALIRVEGVLIDSKDIIEELRDYSDDASIKAVVIRIESPGGAVAPAQEIYEEIVKIKERKKVVVSMGSTAASGGYYIASPADKIVANPGTLTGSIGVIMEIPNIKGLMDKIGVEAQVIKSGRHKDIASMFKSMTEEERKILQGVLDDVHDQFIEAVAKGRGMDINEVRRLADGRIFTGRMAKELGLVDELGDLEDAIMLAGRLSGIKGRPNVVEKKKRFGILEILKGDVKEGILNNVFYGIRLKYILMP